MNISEYQNLAMRTNDGKSTERLLKFIEEHKDIDVGGIINACEGLCGESGEANDMIKKWIFHGHELKEADLVKEIGDVCWYLAFVSECFGLDLNRIMEKNIAKLKNRYPEGFSEQASINRVE